MSNQLEEVKKILVWFQEQLKKKERIWKQSAPDAWSCEEAYCWIYADSNYAFSQCDRSTPIIEAAKQLARPYYDKWLDLERDCQSIHGYIIPPPASEDTLQSYLEQLSVEIRAEGRCKTIRWKSLRSFTFLLHEKLPKGQLGFIEVIFPERMEIFDGKVIRIVDKTVYPVDIIIACKILQKLAHMALEGRANAQQSAATTLGLAWMCLCSSRKRLPTELILIHGATASSVRLPVPDTKNEEEPKGSLALPTLCGPFAIPISKELANYLVALSLLSPPSMGTIIGSPLGSLHRTFQRAVDQVPEAAQLGKITFLTFMSHPHEAFGHRYTPKMA